MSKYFFQNFQNKIDCCQASSKCENFADSPIKPKKTAVAKSEVCPGWGLYALEDLSKGDYIGHYVGEVFL